MSGGVCEPRHENGSTEHRAAVCHIVFCVNPVTLPPQNMENSTRTLEIMQRQELKPFADTVYFLKAEPLPKMSSAAEDNNTER
jgi:hypothetical protein